MQNVEKYEQRVKIYGNKCEYCKVPLTIETFTIDHVMPLAKGGEDTRENTVASCLKCNKRKGKIHPNAWKQHPMHPKNVKRRKEKERNAKRRRNRRKWVY